MEKKRQHFVPQHYLRQFQIVNTKQVATVLVDPYRYIGPAAINRQCQEDYFYGADSALDELMTRIETDLAPVLLRVSQAQNFDGKELVALRMLAVVLRSRTRKAVEHAKVYPRRIHYEVIKRQIERGVLPAPQGGWEESMMDFSGFPGFLINASVVPCFMEMQTLGCKILRTAPSSPFITSDNPVVIFNQFAAGHDPHRSFAGFAQTGFQLIMPIAPALAIFFYDRGVYKVGGRRGKIVDLTARDVALVNSLQIQSAEKCLYFHTPAMEDYVRDAVQAFGRLRVPLLDSLRTFPGRNPKEEMFYIRAQSARLPEAWDFCRYRRKIGREVGQYRDPTWTAVIERLAVDRERNPDGESLFIRLAQLIGDRKLEDKVRADEANRMGSLE